MERGKPLKLATQTLVGARDSWKRTSYSDCLNSRQMITEGSNT